MKRFVAVVALLIAVASGQNKENWKEYSFPRDKFAISAGSVPRVYPDPQNSEVRVYSFQPDPDTWLAVKVGATNIDCDGKRKQLKEDAPPTVSVKEIAVGKHIGIELAVLGKKTPGWVSITRFFCFPDRVILLNIGYPSKSKSLAIKRMLDSLRFTDD